MSLEARAGESLAWVMERTQTTMPDISVLETFMQLRLDYIAARHAWQAKCTVWHNALANQEGDSNTRNAIHDECASLNKACDEIARNLANFVANN